MKLSTKLLIGVLAFAGLTFGFVLVPQTATAQEENQEQAQQPQQEESAVENYTYTAKSGDSYTVLARKAVQTYGINNSVNLTPAEIIFVETNLTQAAGEPLLDVGEDVTVDGNLVAEWVKKAQELTEAQEALWQQYVSGVDFDTSNNG